MKLKSLLPSFLLITSLSGLIHAQIPDGILGDPSEFAETDTTTRAAIYIEPWKTMNPFGFQNFTNDSLLRWQNWAQWGDFLAYQANTISYRQGSNGRIDAFDINGYGPLEQDITVNGIGLKNPFTGLVNYNFIPAYKVNEMWVQHSGSYKADIRLKDYYIIKPLSYLTFDEADFNYRNLEFMVTQNFSEKTNVELSFWDRRDGGGFPQNDVQGSQIMFKGYHFLSQYLQLRAMIMRNQYKREEPFGYVVGDPTTFAFSEFSSQPNESGISSEILRNDIKVALYSRPDSLSKQNYGVEIYRTKNEFDLPFDTDTLHWDLRSWRLKGIANTQLGNVVVSAQAELQSHSTKSLSGLTKGSWNEISVSGNLKLPFTNSLELFSNNTLSYRFDGFQSYNLGAGGSILFGKIGLRLNASLFQRLPTMQQLYWSASDFAGNPDLQETKGISIAPAVDLQLSNTLRFGVSGRYALLDKDVFIGNDSSFVNADAYDKLSATVFGEFSNHRFEIHSSATVDAALATEPTSVLEANNLHDRKIWLRNNAFIKGYVFDKAAYVKAGLRSTLSPIPYRTRLFNTGLQFWENAALEESEIPAFFRLDAELSARVRAIMVLIRWENTLDGFGQAGYFEAATLPMPARRLIVGIRAQFRN